LVFFYRRGSKKFTKTHQGVETENPADGQQQITLPGDGAAEPAGPEHIEKGSAEKTGRTEGQQSSHHDQKELTRICPQGREQGAEILIAQSLSPGLLECLVGGSAHVQGLGRLIAVQER